MEQAPKNTRPENPMPAASWASLLGRWTEFAQSAVALPSEGEAGRWKRVVPDVIGLQALCFALGDVDGLAGQERALGLDRAAVLIRKHAGAINEAWRGEPMPELLDELIGDARACLAAAHDGGVELRVVVATLEVPRFEVDPGEHELLIARPGIELVRGEPAAFVRAGDGGAVSAELLRELVNGLVGVEPARVGRMRQLYLTPEGERVVAELDEDLPSGMPVLGLWRPTS